jgi:hypothetical protein
MPIEVIMKRKSLLSVHGKRCFQEIKSSHIPEIADVECLL